jgi:predicted MFS family arabinose efflux permease
MTMGQAIVALFKNKNYIYMFLSFNFLYGLYCAISGVISSFTDPYGYTPGNISVVCIVFSIAGIFNSFFIGTLLDKYQCYKKTLVFLSFASIITLSLSFWSLPTGNIVLAGGTMVFTGASLIPIVTVCFSFAAELSYPVPESYSIGIMISVGQIFGFVLVRLMFSFPFRGLVCQPYAEPLITLSTEL